MNEPTQPDPNQDGGPTPSPRAKGSRVDAGRSAPPSGAGRDPLRLPVLDHIPVPDRPVVLTDPRVSANVRQCAACGTRLDEPDPVGSAGAGAPGSVEGICPRCEQPYSMRVRLVPGDRVGRYTVHGAIGHGGMGWVYAATDDNLGDGDVQAWVVLKGLLDAANPEARRIAEVERRMLTTVNHPNIVRILDYVSHRGEDYIVMEYVPGVSLSKLMEARPTGPDGRRLPLRPADAIRYLLRLLPALGHLHGRGLVYCDLKPDNVMVTAEQVKLIDLGGARRLDDYVSGFLSTPGYRAPELEKGEHRPPGASRHGTPTIASDIFAATRTLARLVLGRFPGFVDVYRHGLPPRADHQVLRDFESLDHLVRRGTAVDPADRFESTAEMAEELTGILYEIVSRTEGRAPPLASRWFAPAIHPTGESAPNGKEAPPVWHVLPDLRMNADDPQARALTLAAGEDPAALADRLAGVRPITREVRLALARAQIQAGRIDDAEATLGQVAAVHPREWRVVWYRGLLEASRGRPDAAAEAFDEVYFQLPGELAPRLALATASAAAGDRDRAAELFDVVSQLDPAITSAAFGLARCLDDPARRISAYERVPPTAHAYPAARVRMIGVLVAWHPAPCPDELARAAAILDDPLLDLGERRRAELRRDILAAALRLVSPDPPEPVRCWPDRELFGRRLVPRELRFGLEEAYRDIARLTRDRRDRIRLIDQANRVRPRTLC